MTAGNKAKRVAVVQSSYIPWKGYFDLIADVDEFILYDDVQYTKRDWRNRNRIKSQAGPRWLSIPIAVKGKYTQLIKEARVTDHTWRKTHWLTIVSAYAHTSYFRYYKEFFENLYLNDTSEFLSGINFKFLRAICNELNIKTRLKFSMEYQFQRGERTLQLLNLCLQAQARVYVSGPSAKTYLDVEIFRQHGIEVEFFEYPTYPVYEQPYPPFDHAVSVIDLMFCTGRDARHYMSKCND